MIARLKGLFLNLFVLANVAVWFVFFHGIFSGQFTPTFHAVAYYLPTIGILTIISAQFDILSKISEGQEINIKARFLDFSHWLLLLFMFVGRWMVEGAASFSWFVLGLVLLAVIGWGIGIGVKRIWVPTLRERVGGIIFTALAVALGLIVGAVRYMDPQPLGWGWALESATAVISTGIVGWWIWLDMKNISRRPDAYPRSAFLKSIYSNGLAIVFWVHLIQIFGGFSQYTLLVNLGITFNVLVGNLLYLGYYGYYEHCRDRRPGLSWFMGPEF
ncbi:MAG: hypothetical protein Q8P75_03210 [bacterium]|nr:hypothetical protein [bacterium]